MPSVAALRLPRAPLQTCCYDLIVERVEFALVIDIYVARAMRFVTGTTVLQHCYVSGITHHPFKRPLAQSRLRSAFQFTYPVIFGRDDFPLDKPLRPGFAEVSLARGFLHIVSCWPLLPEV